jgi:hypothetical protein
MVLLSHWRKNSANRAANSLLFAGIDSTMRLLQQKPLILLTMVAMVFLLIAIVGCVISPRRIVAQGPSPTPTPSVSPTPAFSPTATPTPTPTPTPATRIIPSPTPTATPTLTPTPGVSPTPSTTMAAGVPQADAPAQFLFTTAPNSLLITGFKVNNDGSLLPVRGSPFLLSSPARGVTSVQRSLIVVGDSTLTVLAVDKETGSIQQTDLVSAPTAASDLSSLAMSASRQAVLDANGRFMYVVDAGRGELAAYRINDGKLSTVAARYPVPDGTSSITLVQP